jgi:hypothetical protein
MEGEDLSILKDNSLIIQPNQDIQQEEQSTSPFDPSFSPPPSDLFLPPSPLIYPSSILINISLITQSTLAPTYLPYPLPPLAPPPPPSYPPPLPPLPSVIHTPILITPKPFILNEGPGTYILPKRKEKEMANHRLKIYDTKEDYDPSDPLDPDIEENTRNILYVNPELARYEIHDKIHFDDEHVLVDSEEDYVSTEEDCDDYLEEVYDDETKVKDYLNEIPEEEVAEINDKIVNYYFDMDKKKYVSKVEGKL